MIHVNYLPRDRRRRVHRREPRPSPARARARAKVVVYDRLTYAGNLDNLADIANDPRYRFVHGDICDRELVTKTLRETDARRRLQPRRRVARRPLHRRPRRVRAHQRRRAPSRCSTRRARSSRRESDELAQAFPLRSRLHRRGVRLARARGLLHRDDAATRPTRPTRRPRPAPITWCARTFTPTGCPSSPPTAPTTTAPTSFPRSSSRSRS